MRSQYRNLLMFLGSVVVVTGILGVAADVLSAWSSDPRGMDTAISVDFDSVR
jgi:Flp pilus assembly pilin Flp